MTNPNSDGTDRVWYASYGSNLLRSRFLCYIHGGKPEGCSREAPGCLDKTDPAGDMPFRMPHELYFAREASGWGEGGVAFLRTRRDASRETLGRAYLITRRQFVSVTAQENLCDPSQVMAALTGGAEPGKPIDFGDGWYGRILMLGTVEGSPVLTFTGREDLSEARTRPPETYVRTILSGLVEAFGDLPVERIAEYLADRSAGLWTAPEVLALREIGRVRFPFFDGHPPRI